MHVQLDLSDFTVTVVDTTPEARAGMVVTAKVYSLDNKILVEREDKKDVAADSKLNVFKLDLGPLFQNGVLLVKLELRDRGGQLVSDNLYWLAKGSASYRELNQLRTVSLSSTASFERERDWVRLHLHIENKAGAAALDSKVTLLDAKGERILPAYYSDNYLSLLSGEAREISIEYPEAAAEGVPQVSIRGWNVAPATIPVSPTK